MNKIGVLGCGTMGSGIGQVCAQAGIEVIMWDINDELATVANIQGGLQRQVDRDRMEQSEMDSVMGRIWILKNQHSRNWMIYVMKKPY